MKNQVLGGSQTRGATFAAGGLISRRSEGLVAQTVGTELLLFNSRTKNCHLLDDKTATLWEQLDEPSSLSEIKNKFAECFPILGPEGDEFVEVTLADFASKGLVEADEVLAPVSEERRRLLKAAGFLMVGTVFVPEPAAAASPDCNSCTAPSLPLLLYGGHAFPENANDYTTRTIVSTTLCIANAPAGRVWINKPGIGDLEFDETVTFQVTSPSHSTETGCATSWEATTCSNCTPSNHNSGSSQASLPALDVTRLFSPVGGQVQCGTYTIVATHCNAQGANTVSSFQINYGVATSMPTGAVVI